MYQEIKYIHMEIEDLRQRIEKLSIKIEELTAQVESTTARMDGLPKGTKQNESREILIDMKIRYEEQEQRLLTEMSRMLRMIEEYPDSLTRLILRYRFIDGLSWGQIAFKLGGNNTSDSVRMMAQRVINKEVEK